MATTPPSNEAIQPGEKKKFDIDKALNTKGFAAFLAKHPEGETFDMENAEELEKKFETFAFVKTVDQGIQGLFAKQINEELGIKLEDKERELISGRIEEYAIESPEKLEELNQKLILMTELPKQIKSLEDELAKLGAPETHRAEYQSLVTESGQLQAGQKEMGLFAKIRLSAKALFWLAKKVPTYIPGLTSDSYKRNLEREGHNIADRFDAARLVREKYGDKSKREVKTMVVDVNEKIKAKRENIIRINDVENMRSMIKDSYSELRKGVFEEISSIGDLSEIIRGKAQEKLKQMINGGQSIKDFDNAQEYFDKLRASQEGGAAGIDPFEGLNEDERQAKIEEGLDKRVWEHIANVLTQQQSGSNMLTNLERALKPVLDREKMGTKEGDELREAITSALLETSNQVLSGSPEDKTKRIIVNRLIVKINSK